MRKGKQLCFDGESIFCGLDVHKKNWRVNIRSAEFELEDYSQDPSTEILINHLNKNYPGAKVKVAYEAGFCGFGIERSLKAKGIECLVVNPADVPTSDKEKKRKQDSVDARKICKCLREGALQGIYVPDQDMEQARSLVRHRCHLVKDHSRCKNRIWHLLMFSGLPLQEEKKDRYWSHRFVQSLKDLKCPTTSLRKTLDLAIEEYEQLRKTLFVATKAVRSLSQEEVFVPVQELLQSVKGIGLITAMTVQTEIQDMHRFKTLDKLCAFVGFVPDSSDSGELHYNKGLTHRCNWYLRTALIESAWMVLRYNRELLLMYKQYRRRMTQNKAIIKMAKHLLSIIRYVWRSGKKYEPALGAGA
jgi:transposase